MILETDKIRLKLTQLDDLQKIIRIENDNSEFIGQYDFERHKTVIKSEDEEHISIFHKLDNNLVGHVILAGLKNENDSIEFRRIVISKKGEGIGTDSVGLIREYCFENLKAHRIWLDVLSDNHRAIKLYLSQGFKTEEVIQHTILQNGKCSSLTIMSILRTDSGSDVST
jgi:diamine N-acetyltransferase